MALEMAYPRKEHKMHQFDALKGLKRHVLTPFPMLFPLLGEQMSDADFRYPDLI